jgi:hypothetical protein
VLGIGFNFLGCYNELLSLFRGFVQSLDEAHSSPGLHAAAGSGLAEECATLVLFATEFVWQIEGTSLFNCFLVDHFAGRLPNWDGQDDQWLRSACKVSWAYVICIFTYWVM